MANSEEKDGYRIYASDRDNLGENSHFTIEYSDDDGFKFKCRVNPTTTTKIVEIP